MIPPIVLASRSPRRRELLLAAGVRILEVTEAQTEESHDASCGVAALVLANARAKAGEISARHPDSVVLAADTLVWHRGHPLGKPRDSEDAQGILQRLSGQVHEVVTGVHLVRATTGQQIEFHEVTRVRFRPLDEKTIRTYLAKVDVLDKAGAYALQKHGELLIESVEGSRSNVIGLPVARTLAALQHFAERA